MSRKSARQTIKRLNEIRNQYGTELGAEKIRLLKSVPELAIRSSSDIQRLHLTLCFLRAFPDSLEVFDAVSDLLADFSPFVEMLSESQQYALVDSGLAGTDVHYQFSYEVAAWLARRYPGIASIDWEALDNSARLDELLEHLLHQSETDYFDSGQVSTEEWIQIAAAHQSGTDFDWLMSQLHDRRHHNRFWTSLYNAAEVPLRCKLGRSSLSRGGNFFPWNSMHARSEMMQSRVHRAKQEIARPVQMMRLLSKRHGANLIDVGMSSLAVRHRETNHFNHANPEEVWLAPVGKGVTIAATGLMPEHRFPLECTMGFLILSNGAPIGYGGSSVLYRQVNNGINIFEEYRGSEAAWLWVQVMRVYHALSGCTRFVANPYQFGSENTEALKSGAFWFYYRLGYRPVDSGVRKLARNEYMKLKSGKGYRTPIPVLKDLATCDMHLTLPSARQADFFDEGWIETASLLATEQLAKTGHRSRRKAHDDIARRLVEDLGVESMDDWSQEERRWFVRLGPVMAATNPGSWTARDKRSAVKLMRAKGSDHERDFMKVFCKHERFYNALKKVCRQADSR